MFLRLDYNMYLLISITQIYLSHSFVFVLKRNFQNVSKWNLVCHFLWKWLESSNCLLPSSGIKIILFINGDAAPFKPDANCYDVYFFRGINKLKRIKCLIEKIRQCKLYALSTWQDRSRSILLLVVHLYIIKNRCLLL